VKKSGRKTQSKASNPKPPRGEPGHGERKLARAVIYEEPQHQRNGQRDDVVLMKRANAMTIPPSRSIWAASGSRKYSQRRINGGMRKPLRVEVPT